MITLLNLDKVCIFNLILVFPIFPIFPLCFQDRMGKYQRCNKNCCYYYYYSFRPGPSYPYPHYQQRYDSQPPFRPPVYPSVYNHEQYQNRPHYPPSDGYYMPPPMHQRPPHGMPPASQGPPIPERPPVMQHNFDSRQQMDEANRNEIIYQKPEVHYQVCSINLCDYCFS